MPVSAACLRVLAVVEADRDELARARDRRADARSLRNDWHLLEVDRADRLQLFWREPVRRDVRNEQRQVALHPSGVERAGALGTDGAMPEKLHPFLPCRINRFNAYKNLLSVCHH